MRSISILAYPFQTMGLSGKYKVVLDSDEAEFDGFSRIKNGEEHISLAEKSPNGNRKYDHTLYLYLPSRCVLVLKKID